MHGDFSSVEEVINILKLPRYTLEIIISLNKKSMAAE
jgi:hypothetical protein